MKPKRNRKMVVDNGVVEQLVEESAPVDRSPYVAQRDKPKFTVNLRNNIPFTEKQKAFIELAKDKHTKVVFFSGPAGTSKAQPLDAKILTPAGWALMGDMQIGTEVITPDNKTASVIGIFPQGIKDVYRVTFSDGSFTECTADHLWLTQLEKERNRRSKVIGTHRIENGKRRNDFYKNPLPAQVRSLEEIIDTLMIGSHLNHSIPMVEPIEFAAKSHIIHPYILGALIGDGSLTIGTPSITTADPEIINKIKSLLPEGIMVNQLSNELGITYSITDIFSSWTTPNRITHELRRLGLYGHKSYTKFIPEEYLFDSVENRLELLRGLMDTDGTTDGTYSSYCTVSPQLSKDVQHLIQSLGGNANKACRKNSYTYRGIKKQGADSYVVSVKLNNGLNPFFLSRKKDLIQPRIKYFPIRYIAKVELVSKKQCQCILLDSPEHLYITDDFIVTHNTLLSVYVALLLLNDKKSSEIIYVRSIIESASKSLGSLPGESDEKFSPFAQPLLDKLEELLSKGDINKLFADERIKPMPVNYLRGASFSGNTVILDESQNLTKAEIKTVISRIGRYSKFIICGDPQQSDINGKSGFRPFFDMFNTAESQEQGIYCVEFGKEDIMRSEILKYIVGVIEQYEEKYKETNPVK